MKIVIDKSDLNIATARSQGAISDRAMAQIGLKAVEDRLHVSVADRVLVIYSTLACEVLTPGDSFVPARLFSDVVRELPEGPVTLEKTDTFLVITAGTRGEFVMKLPRTDDREWRDPPVIDSDNFADLPSGKLHYMIDQVHFCVAQESPRNYGAVGFFHKPADGKLRLVGTDGFRLSFSEIAMDLPGTFLDSGVCLSKRALNEMQRMCSEGFENIRISISEDQTTLAAAAPDYQIYVRLSAVKYPNYQGVLPSNDLTPVEIARPYMQSVIKRVLLAADKTKAIRLCFSGDTLTMRSRTVGSSEGEEAVPLEDFSGEDRILTINGKFLNDVFSTISSTDVALSFKSEDDPIVLIPKKEPASCHSMHVLVPIRETN